MMVALSEVTVVEVSRLIGALPAKISTLDFMPISLIKSCADVMTPVIVGLANRFFSTGVFLSTLKHGHVTPLLKKPGLDKTAMANYHQPKHSVEAAGKAGAQLSMATYAIVREFQLVLISL